MDLVDKLFDEGLLVIKSFRSEREIKDIKESCLCAQKAFEAKGGKKSNIGSHIENPFVYNDIFMPIIADERVCTLVETAIGDRVTLVNSALINRQIYDSSNDISQVGSKWHTDSRYVQRGQVKLAHGFGYIAALCIDNFSHVNGSTMYVPGSHLFAKKPPRVVSPNFHNIKSISADSGDLFIIDSGLWHCGGIASSESRWGLFSFYSPWYFKPYFNFSRMFSETEILKMSPRVLDLLHFTSDPPASQLERVNTLETAEEVRAKLANKVFAR